MLWVIRTAVQEGPVWGIALSLSGFALLVFNSWLSPGARRAGRWVHWLSGWFVNGFGMLSIAGGWYLLATGGPHLEWPSLTWIGAVAATCGVTLFVASAARVGRLHAPSRYANELDRSGIYSRIRHPQALALAILSVGVGGLSRSVPSLLTVPLWVFCWWGYALLEEKLELVPVFGERYRRYCRSTPCLLPALRSLMPGTSSVGGGLETIHRGLKRFEALPRAGDGRKERC